MGLAKSRASHQFLQTCMTNPVNRIGPPEVYSDQMKRTSRHCCDDSSQFPNDWDQYCGGCISASSRMHSWRRWSPRLALRSMKRTWTKSTSGQCEHWLLKCYGEC